MKWLIRILLVFLLVTILLAFFHAFLAGMILDPFLEMKLNTLFGMKVEIDGLRADLFSGNVKASRIVFYNQLGFTPGPHLDVPGIEFDIRFPALLEKKVLIGSIKMNRPYYFIERMSDAQGKSYSNLSEWVDHINQDDDTPSQTAVSQEQKRESSETASSSWQVSIQKIEIREGKFTYLSREAKQPSLELVFSRLNGFLKGFHWPVKDPEFLEEEVSMNGVFGKNFPAPFQIRGFSNFATSQVSFDLMADIPDGDMMEHERLWDGLPLKLKGGRFSMKLHAVCKRRILNSESLLTLRKVDVVPRKSVEGTLWGLPLAGSMALLEREKSIQLLVPVKGDISNPEYGFDTAFRKAFQDALAGYAESGMNFITGTSSQLFHHGKLFAEKAPTRLLEGLADLSNVVMDQALFKKEAKTKTAAQKDEDTIDSLMTQSTGELLEI